MSSTNTTLVGVTGTGFSLGLKMIATVADRAQALTVAEWASLAVVFSATATGIWMCLQVANRMRNIWRAWRGKRDDDGTTEL